MLALLDAFTAEQYAWDVESLSQRFGYTASSTYRYVRALSQAGLLIRLPRGLYVIGARVIELETLIRQTDPMTAAGRPLLRELAQETGCHVLLASVYGNHLINIAHEPGIEALELTYLRGRELPWFRGAPGKAALAFMGRARLRTLYEVEFRQRLDASTAEGLHRALRAIKKVGYCVRHGQLDPHVLGIGAPVFIASERQVLGSLSLVCSAHRAQYLNESQAGQRLRQAGLDLGQRLLEQS